MTILQFPGAPPPPTDGDEPSLILPPPPMAVLHVLTEFTEKVMRGDVAALGIVCVQRDGSTCLNSAQSRGNIQLLLAATTLLESVLRQKILQTMMSHDDQPQEP